MSRKMENLKKVSKVSGECSICHRIRPLGRVDGDYLACIDCHFGPPMQYWERCNKCGSLEVNPEAFCFECEDGGKRIKAREKALGRIIK